MKKTSARKCERHLVYRTVLFLLLEVTLGSVRTASAQEPTLLEIFTRLGLTNIVEVSDETFPAGTYDLQLLARFGDNQNTISQYPVGTDQFQELITSSEGNVGFTDPPITKRFVTQVSFGLEIFTPTEHQFFTERARNSDGMQHARIFRNLNAPGSFLIGFEDLMDGDQDFQDVVLALTRVATDPSIGSNSVEILSYQASGYKFQIIPQEATPPRGFEQPGFDDSAFATGSAAFGAGGGGAIGGGDCPLRSTVKTEWPLESQLLVRREITIPTGTTNIRVMVSVDNDVRGVFFNGRPLIEHSLGKSSVTHEECPILDEFRFDVPPKLVRTGSNLVAFHVLDRSSAFVPTDESFFDARILADLLPDQLLEIVAVQQAPLVPVRDVAIDTRIDPNSAQRSATITYGVAATGEFGEIRLEQISPDRLTATSFLGNELIGSSTATPDGVTISSSVRAAERFADLADPGILSASSVFANPTVLEGLFQFSATLAGSSCEEACNEQAEQASFWLRLRAAPITISCSNVLSLRRDRNVFDLQGSPCLKKRGISAAAEAQEQQRIEALRQQCLAACNPTHLACQGNRCATVSGAGADECSPVGAMCGVPPPGSLTGAFIFDASFGTQPFDQTVIFTGQLVQGLGGPGRTSFGPPDPPPRTERITPGVGAKVIGFGTTNLTAGTWTVTATAPGLTVPQTCFNVRVPGNIRIDVSGGQGLRCQ